MPLALPALDLAAFLIFAVLFVLALTVKTWLHAVFQVLDKVIGWVPFAGHWVKAGENHVLSALNVVVVRSRDAMSTLLSGLRWSLREFETGVQDMTSALSDRWEQLVHHAIPSAFDNLWGETVGRLNALGHRIDGIDGDIADSARAVKSYALAQAGLAQSEAIRYADTAAGKVHDFVVDHVHGIYEEVEADISGALRDAERYTDSAVAGLRSAEDAAVAAARGAASAALTTARNELTAGIAAVSASLEAMRQAVEGELAADATAARSALAAAVGSLTGEIEGDVGALQGALAAAEDAAGHALATAVSGLEGELGAAGQAAAAELHATATALSGTIGAVSAQLGAVEAAAAGELTDIYNLPADALRDLLDRLDLTKVASLGAGLVLARALVNAITREAGLDSAECRGKVKQVCGTPGDEWGDLLAGAAFVTGALSLAELIVPARQAVALLADAMRQAA